MAAAEAEAAGTLRDLSTAPGSGMIKAVGTLQAGKAQRKGQQRALSLTSVAQPWLIEQPWLAYRHN